MNLVKITKITLQVLSEVLCTDIKGIYLSLDLKKDLNCTNNEFYDIMDILQNEFTISVEEVRYNDIKTVDQLINVVFELYQAELN